MRRTILFAALLLVAVSAFGQDDSWRNRRYYRRDANRNTFELTPFGGYRYGGTIFADQTSLFATDVDVASSVNYGADFGIPISNTGLKLEFMVNRQNTHLETGNGLFDPTERVADIDLTYYHAGLQVPFATSRAAEPFLIFSAGVTNLDPQIGGVAADNRFSASAGIGVKVPVNRNLGIRVEARGYFTSLSNNNNDNCNRCRHQYDHDLYQGETNVGLVFRF